MTHHELCLLGEKFLVKNNFGLVFNDRFKASTYTGEQPDVLGFRSHVSCLLECKTSRSDFLADRKKKFRIEPNLGMGDWRFMLCPVGLISTEELPVGWGLLEVSEKGRILKTFGWPPNALWISNKPFVSNKESEMSYMYSALRRMQIRGASKRNI